MFSEDKLIDEFRVRMYYVNGLKIGVALDIGPRILYLGLDDEQFNLFNIVPGIQLETPDGTWRIYGGHRLWVAPEDFPRTYAPEDKPVHVDVQGNSIVITGNPELPNNVLKRMRIEPGDRKNTLVITHEITNIGRWPLEYACWAISVMQSNGLAVIPIKPKHVDKRGLLPDRIISIWPYTRLNDPRLVFGEDYIILKHDPRIEKPIKIGAKANPPLSAYLVNKYLFIKHIKPEEIKYPDHGVTVEVYANDKILELETLGPLRTVEPGESNKHVEKWEVRKIEELEISDTHLVRELLSL